MLERVTQISIRHVCKMYLQFFISNSEEDASELLRNHKEIVINGKVWFINEYVNFVIKILRSYQ